MRPVTDPRSAARATRLGDDRRHAVRATGPDDRRHAARATDPADRRLVAKATGPADRKQAARATAHEGVRAPVVKAIGVPKDAPDPNGGGRAIVAPVGRLGFTR